MATGRRREFLAAPIERILARYPGVVLSAVYAVPDEEVGDQVMAALEVVDPGTFDPVAFDRFLDEQDDLGTKWSPRYVRLSAALPVTETKKVQKRKLRSERWECDEPVLHRPGRGEGLRPMTATDREALHDAFVARGRESALI